MFDKSEYSKKYCRERYYRFKSEHKCVICGEQLEESHKGVRCDFCRDKARIAQRISYQNRKLRAISSLGVK